MGLIGGIFKVALPVIGVGVAGYGFGKAKKEIADFNKNQDKYIKKGMSKLENANYEKEDEALDKTFKSLGKSVKYEKKMLDADREAKKAYTSAFSSKKDLKGWNKFANDMKKIERMSDDEFEKFIDSH